MNLEDKTNKENRDLDSLTTGIVIGGIVVTLGVLYLVFKYVYANHLIEEAIYQITNYGH